MRRTEAKPLHPKEVSSKPPGEWPDGPSSGLSLRVRPNGARSRVVRYGLRADRVTMAPADSRPGSYDTDSIVWNRR